MNQQDRQPPLVFLFRAALFCLLLASSGLYAQISYFHAVTGSYHNEQSAAAQLLLLEQRNLKGVLLFPTREGDVYRISVFQSLYKDQAEKRVKELQKQGFKKAWVYEQTSGKPNSGTAQQVAATNAGAKPGQAASPTQRVGQQPITVPPSPSYQPEVTAGVVNYLVVGSAKNLSDGEALQNKLVTEGYKTYLLAPDKPNGQFRIAVFRQEDKGAVMAYQAKVKSRFPDSWILSKKEEVVPATVDLLSQQQSRGMDNGRNNAPEGSRFHLVVSSHKELSNAIAERDRWARQGFAAVLLPAGAGISEMFRVSVFQSANRVEVDKEQERLKELGWQDKTTVVVSP